MDEINYISRHLLSKIKDIDLRLSSKAKEIISRKTNEIIKHLTIYDYLKFKKYNDLKIVTDYTLDTNEDVNLLIDKPNSFEYTDEILKKINKKKNFTLKLKKNDGFDLDYNINIEIYHNNQDNEEILYKNINKLLTRLWNLFKLFIKKYENSITYTFKIYLYTKPKTANNNNTGNTHFKKLNDERCFNSYNGVTTPDMTVLGSTNFSNISRLEESVSLLTHEFLHVVNLNNASVLGFNTENDGGKVFWHDTFEINNNPMESNEIFVNSFTTIYHAYLLSKEIDTDSNDFKLENIVRNEIIYSMVLSIRLSKITKISIKDIYNRNNLIPNINFGE
jgi:hypothetical protein